MLAETESACFVIADITGYTSFLAGVELDHAQDIIADLMDTVLTTLLPMPDAPKVLMSYAFCETAGEATHIEIRVAKPKPKDMAFLEQVGAKFHETITREVAVLRGMLEGKAGGKAAMEEPPMPVLAERFLTQPIHAR